MRIVTAGTFACLTLAACGGGDRTDAGQDTTMAAAPVAMADTTAEALWAHLTGSRYQDWATWPGKGKLYRGQDPHGMLLTTYLNGLALDALTNGAARMPDGAIIVKENYMPDSALAAVTVMFKKTGYDPANIDWYWIKRLADGTVEAQGRVAMCQSCHGGQAANDYLFTGSLSR